MVFLFYALKLTASQIRGAAFTLKGAGPQLSALIYAITLTKIIIISHERSGIWLESAGSVLVLNHSLKALKMKKASAAHFKYLTVVSCWLWACFVRMSRYRELCEHPKTMRNMQRHRGSHVVPSARNTNIFPIEEAPEQTAEEAWGRSLYQHGL